MQKFPLLFWALFFLIGCSCILFPHWIYIVPCIALLYLTKRKGQGLVFLVSGAAYTFLCCSPTKIPELEGRGIFQLEKIEPIASPFQRCYALKGNLLCFESSDQKFFQLPCMVLQKKLPPHGSRFILEGTLSEGILKLNKKTVWKQIKAPLSLVRWRYENKEKIRKFFHKKIKDAHVGHFFASLATGDVDDRLLAMEFRKVGLGHILAISGFHFALVASMLGAFFRLCLPGKWTYGLLLLSLCVYFLFLGFSPSILRAFLMIAFYLLGKLLQRPIEMCNLLGAALLIELIQDPQIATQVGFQLTFLATLGIFLYYKPIYQLLLKFLPERSYREVETMGRLDQHGYVLVSLLRKGIALNSSVHLVTLPVILATFHSFPLLSLPYNLIFSPLLGISMFLLPLGVLLPPLGAFNEKFTGFLLNMVANPPELLHYQIFIQNIPYSTLITTATLLGIFGLTKREQTG